MSENSFDHSSSVHLRDLNKLVFAFSTEEKNQSTFQVNDNPQDSNLRACFGVSNTGIDTKKDEAITLQTSTRDDYAALDQNQRDLILEQSFDGNVEEVDMEEELSSGSCAETDPDETQKTKNSLHLITELCDRLLSRDGKRFEDVPRTGNTVNTPYTSERLNYSSTHETIAHCISTICSSDDGFYQPSSLYSCATNNTYKEWPDSINEQNGAATLCIANTRYSTYNNQQNHVGKRLQSFETSELSCAISNIQQMLAQISPPAHSVTGSLSQISDHNGQLPSDEIIQCISIKEPFTGNVCTERVFYFFFTLWFYDIALLVNEISLALCSG